MNLLEYCPVRFDLERERVQASLFEVSLFVDLQELSCRFCFSCIVVWSSAESVSSAVFRSFPMDDFEVEVSQEFSVSQLSLAEFLCRGEVCDVLVVGVYLDFVLAS